MAEVVTQPLPAGLQAILENNMPKMDVINKDTITPTIEPPKTDTSPKTTPPITEAKKEGDVIEETDEQIQAKLDDLAKLDEKTLTEDQKAYIEKYTSPQDDEITSVKNLFSEKYGLDLKEAKFENSSKGLVELSEAVVPILANNMLLEHFDRNPIMADFYKHVMLEGKSLDTFMVKNQKPAFETIEIKEVNPEMSESDQKRFTQNQKDLVVMDLKAKGVSQEDIDTLVDLYAAGGTLHQKASSAKTAMKALHTANVQAQLQAEDARIANEQKAKDDQDKLARNIISKNDFNGKAIPVASVKAFEKALFEEDNQGYTLLDYKRSKLTLADRLYLDYLVFNDMKGINATAPVKQNKFNFKKAAEENDGRGGSRTIGGSLNLSGSEGGPKNIQEFFNNLNNNKGK